jgi:type I restriction enzyme M protein
MTSAADLAQYFTPPAVVDLTFDLLAWLRPDLPSATLVDPSCGAGAFLQGALRAGFRPGQLYGLDADDALLPLWAKSFLPGQRPHLAIGDGLGGGGQGRFDLVAGNPPYAGPLSPADDFSLAARYAWWQALGTQAGQQGLPREIWFLERSLGLLRPGGLLALVLPEGLFANHRWRGVRRLLQGACRWEALIGLPRCTFRASRATVKTCLLIATRQPAEPGHQVRLAELHASDPLPYAPPLLEAWASGATVAPPDPWR